MTKADYLKQWLHKAEKDLTLIHQATDRPESEWLTDIICYHAQQAVEKAFKAYLIHYDTEPPRTHSLETLLEKMREVSSNTNRPLMRRVGTYG